MCISSFEPAAATGIACIATVVASALEEVVQDALSEEPAKNGKARAISGHGCDLVEAWNAEGNERVEFGDVAVACGDVNEVAAVGGRPVFGEIVYDSDVTRALERDAALSKRSTVSLGRTLRNITATPFNYSTGRF